MIKTRGLLPAFVLGSSLLLLAVGTTLIVLRSEEVPSPLEQKFAEAERLRCYILRAGTRAPEFQLSGREERLRLITHAVMPKQDQYDPEREVVYGVRFILHSVSGALLWQRDVYTKSRQSKLERAPFGFRYENAFVVGLDLDITDDRVLDIDLPASVPWGSRLRLEPLGAAPEVVVRMYNRGPRQRLGMATPTAALAPEERDTAVRRRTDIPWDRLQPDERDTLLKYKWERVGAEGEEGNDFATRIIYYTGLRVPRATASAGEGTPLWPAHDLAFNVRGPATFELGISPDRVAPPHQSPQCVEVERRSAEGVAAAGRSCLPIGSAHASTRLEVPIGIHTLVLRTLGDTALRATLTAEPGSLARLETDMLLVPDQPVDLVPDVKRIRAVSAQAAGEPVRIGFEPGSTVAARTLRIDVRIHLPAGNPTTNAFAVASEASATLSLSMRDGEGAEIDTEELAITAPRSRFEQVASPDGLASDVTEPWPVRLVVPSHVVQLELRATSLVYLRLSSLTEEPNELDVPYRDLESDWVRFRYATLTRRTYWPFLPDNYQMLTEEQRVGTVLAQVRLEPVFEAEEEAIEGLPTRIVQPLGAPESHAVLEPVAPDKRLSMIGAWDSGALTELRPGGVTPLLFGPPASARASLSFWVAVGAEASSLGQSVSIRVDDTVVSTLVLRETRGSLQLPPIAPGRHRFEIVTSAERTHWYVNQPPAEAAGTIHRKRTLYDLRPGRTLRVQGARRAGPRAGLYMVAYARTKEALVPPQFRVRIDGGTPQRVEGKLLQTLTRPDRITLLRVPFVAEQGVFLDLRGALTGYPRQLMLGFGDDIESGPHSVEVTNIGSEAVWARFFEVGVASRARERMTQRTIRLESAGGDE